MNELSAQIRRRGLALAAVGFGGFGADYLFNVGLSRLLSAHEFGDFRVAYAFASFVGVLVLLGGDRAAPKMLAGWFLRREAAAVWEYLRFYGLVALGLSAVVVAVTWLGAFLHLGVGDPKDHHALAWVAPVIPFIALGALVSRALQSSNHILLASLPWRIVFPLLQLAAIGAFYQLDDRVDVHEAIVLGLIVVIVIDLWQWRQLRRLELSELGRDRTRLRGQEWLAASMPMMGAFLVSLALNQSDLYFLEALGDEQEVGHYAAAATSAHFLLVLQGTILGVIAPLVQPALDAGIAEARSLYRSGQRLMLAVAVPATLLLAAASRPVLRLFGPGYAAAEVELIFLSIGNMMWVIAGLSALWLQYSGRASRVLGLSIVVLIADSALNLLLIPRFGMRGAAISTAATLTVAALVILLERRRA